VKRYFLFAGDNYYPDGGWDDFKSMSDDIEELKNSTGGWDWAHIIDSTTGRRVAFWGSRIKEWI
jgi:hypothetical protein